MTVVPMRMNGPFEKEFHALEASIARLKTLCTGFPSPHSFVVLQSELSRAAIAFDNLEDAVEAFNG